MRADADSAATVGDSSTSTFLGRFQGIRRTPAEGTLGGDDKAGPNGSIPNKVSFILGTGDGGESDDDESDDLILMTPASMD